MSERNGILPQADAPARVAVAADERGAAARSRVEALAARLGLPLAVSPGAGAHELCLVWTGARLELRDVRARGTRGVAVDFTTGDLRPNSPSRSRRQPIAKAVGAPPRRVVDATAGLGQDAFRLACLGHDVTAIERSPVLAALLEDGIRRAREDDRTRPLVEDRLRVQCAEAREALPALEADVVFLDPMFPPRRKRSALPKLGIRLVRRLVGDDPDAASLVEVARAARPERLVIKRPPDAGPLVPDPTFQCAGKLARYDVYVSPPT